MEFERCKEILLRENELVRSLASLQVFIREAVTGRDWNGLQDHFIKLDEIGHDISELEVQRQAFFSAWSSNGNEAEKFYAFALSLPLEQRLEIKAVYRKLKFETLKVKTESENIARYIASARAAAAALMEIAYPERSGNVYTPYGKPVSHDMRSMVLNRTL